MIKSKVFVLRNLLLAIGLALSASAAHQDRRNGNHSARLAALYSLVCERRLAVNSMAHETLSIAQVNGRILVDKPPGVTLLALPSFALAVQIFGEPHPSLNDPHWEKLSWLTTMLSVGVFGAVGAWACARWLELWVPPTIATMTATATFLGSFPLVYCGTLTSHLISISLMFVGLYVLKLAPGKNRVSPLRTLLAGLALSYAIACEFSVGLAVLSVCALATLRQRSAPVWMFLGAVPSIALVLANNFASFGMPLVFGYRLNESFSLMQRGFFGIGIMSPYPGILDQLLGFRDGILIWHPVLLLSLLGIVRVAERYKAYAVVVTIAVVLHLGFISSYLYGSGGNGIGTRFHAPLLPLICPAIAMTFLRHCVPSVIVSLWSSLITVSITFAGIYIPFSIENPFLGYLLPRLAARQLDALYCGDSIVDSIRLAMLIAGLSMIALAIISTLMHKKITMNNQSAF